MHLPSGVCDPDVRPPRPTLLRRPAASRRGMCGERECERKKERITRGTRDRWRRNARPTRATAAPPCICSAAGARFFIAVRVVVAVVSNFHRPEENTWPFSFHNVAHTLGRFRENTSDGKTSSVVSTVGDDTGAPPPKTRTAGSLDFNIPHAPVSIDRRCRFPAAPRYSDTARRVLGMNRDYFIMSRAYATSRGLSRK